MIGSAEQRSCIPERLDQWVHPPAMGTCSQLLGKLGIITNHENIYQSKKKPTVCIYGKIHTHYIQVYI